MPKLHLNGEEGAWFNGYSDRVRRCEVSQLEDLNRAMAYIEEHLDGTVDMDVLARIAWCSKYQLQRMFPYLTA